MTKSISTSNKEIYEKFNMLHFTDEVVLRNTNVRAISRVINNINREEETLVKEKIEDVILVKRIKPIDFNIYLK